MQLQQHIFRKPLTEKRKILLAFKFQILQDFVLQLGRSDRSCQLLFETSILQPRIYPETGRVTILDAPRHALQGKMLDLT